MIQELLGANSSLLSENRKFSFFEPTPNPNTTTTTTTNSSTPNPNPIPNPSNPSSTTTENLRCPRCDSSNTKFCYYNNYNLTQPRHFCKTCRRYWTKGGALRNVPIGGGCRKNKPAPALAGKSIGSTKSKALGLEIGRSSYGFDHFSSSPFLFGSPQSSHLFSLLRVSQNANPDLGNSFGVKEEGSVVGNLNHLNMAEMTVVSGGQALGFDPQARNPLPLGFCSPIWKTSQPNGFNSELTHHNSGIQDLYQRLRSSLTNSFNPENSPLVLSSVACSSSSSLASTSNANSSSSSTILESSPVGEAELGNWNPTFSWSDLPSTNGAYP